ncbi:hypothetical protein ACFLTE_09815 [Bacteroidota bacterium]
MKQIISILLISICTYFLHSCSSDDETSLRIEISDKYILTEKDVEFYDSSTCMLFLKEKISLQLTDSDIYSSKDFSIYIDNDFIYNGIFFPVYASMISPSPIYIACYTHDSIDTDLLHFKYVDFPLNSIDDRNNSILINLYKKNNLLRNGISCTIENIEPSSIDNSILNFELMIKNNDNYPYLIPDLSKISSDQFFMLSGGFNIKNYSTNENIPQRLDNYILDKTIMSLDNLTILNKKDKATFSVTAKYTSDIKKGTYSCELHFGNITYLNFIDLELNQNDGRVWIGEDYTKTDFEIK